ncbi:MAG: DUF58 domain-containing protein [Tannerella sp.]|jgi:uncharacterized protein (DUF58 family)|nr:DUF58 domain-containing protein [Tannerella sp.]
MNGYPNEVVTSLNDLMRFEYLVQQGNILPKRPIYSILAGQHPAKMRGRGLDFEEVRLYVPGDDVRNIDWKVTARTNETHSKVFNEEKERPTFVLLDQSAMMFFGSQRYVKSVTAAHVAAIVAFHTIKRGDRFGGIIFNEDSYDYVEPKRSKALVEHFFQMTVERNKVLPLRKTVKSDTGLINEMLHRMQSLITHDYVIAIISNILMLNQDSQHLLRSLSYHNDVIFVHIEDPMDKLLPHGKLVLTDGDKQIEWDSNKNNWGDKYSAGYNLQLDSMIENFRYYGIPVSIINTKAPVEEQVKDKIGGRLRK